MSQQLYACIHAAEFPMQAWLRLRPEWQDKPVAVFEGRAPLEQICSMNAHARQRGAVVGMSRLESEAIEGLHRVARSVEGETAARSVLLECAAKFSPRMEAASQDTACVCVLDIAGTERLFGPPATLAQRLRAELAAAGFRASIAVSSNFHTARLKAVASRGVTVVPAGEEADALSRLTVGLLNLPEEHAETCAIWGIRTLGELAALPEAELIARMGQQARIWRSIAQGIEPHLFQSVEPAFSLKELYEFETPVEQIESLLFVAARMVDCLASRASSRALSLASMTVGMSMEGGRVHRRVICPALPSTDRKFLLKLLQLEIASHPPQAAVVNLTIAAEAGQSSQMQLGLFAPQTPEPSRLDVTIARLKAIAGEDRVGSPVLEDTHRPGSFRMESFAVPAEQGESSSSRVRIALRRMRPAMPVRVLLQADTPLLYHDGKHTYRVLASFGPWRSSGCWWSIDGWDAEEWDVLVQAQDHSQAACLLVRDRTRNAWNVEAYFD